MHKLNPRTAALLSAFGWAVGYLLAGKVLTVLLDKESTNMEEDDLMMLALDAGAEDFSSDENSAARSHRTPLQGTPRLHAH